MWMTKEVTQKKQINLQIVSEILDKCVKPQTKTSIVHDSVLSCQMLDDYLAELQEAELLEASTLSEAKYVTTAKGLIYLKKYRELQEIPDS